MIPLLLKVARTGIVTEDSPGAKAEWRARSAQI